MSLSNKTLDHGMPIIEQIQESMAAIRKSPAEARHRVALAQLYMASREWQKAVAQLECAATLSPACIPLAGAYTQAIECEQLREKVLSGERSPEMFETAPGWFATLLSALHALAKGDSVKAADLRERAFDEAEVCAVEINDEPALWLADADSRLGPICELFVEGKYHWVPFSDISMLEADAPQDLRDLFWLPCHVKMRDGRSFSALMPCRYPGQCTTESDDILLCRRTEWVDAGEGGWVGAGQKLLITDKGEYSMLALRSLVNQDACLSLKE